MESPHTALTDRDIQILLALDRCPLTLRQLLKLSEAFPTPFTSYRRVHQRLQSLCEAGWVRLWRYASASGGAENYYTLSPQGFHYLHGVDCELPGPRRFSAVGLAREPHTRALADFIVHTLVAAYRSNVLIGDFWRENDLQLNVDGESLYPDCAFQLLTPGDRTFTFYVELDNGTQSVHSPKERESWERKIRFYERYRDSSATRFRVLVVSTHSQQRLAHILKTAAALTRNPDRSLVYAVGLSQYLGHAEPLEKPCFSDHRGQPVPLVHFPADLPTVLLRSAGAVHAPL
ncbi:MAG: replication-relaxation family protein [Planctomycetes bacterium]|nr:replication-relaxation family protein [Planctomycetota bacterium]